MQEVGQSTQSCIAFTPSTPHSHNKGTTSGNKRKVKASSDDISKAVNILQDLTVKTNEAISHVNTLLERVQEVQISTAKGVSFLEVKYQLMLGYLVDLAIVVNRKVRGQSIADTASVDRLVEIRTVLEKIKPIDQKLKYQIDKLIKTSTSGKIDENDPLSFKPNPKGLVSKVEGEESGSGEEGSDANSDDGEEGPAKQGVYRPPKLTPMYYEGDLTLDERRQRATERIHKKIRSSRLMRDLQQELNDGPEEIREEVSAHQARLNKYEHEKERYEEEYFVRRVETRKEKSMRKKGHTVQELNGITRFGDISALAASEDQFIDEVLFQKTKKKGGGQKRKGKSGKKGGARKKRRF